VSLARLELIAKQTGHRTRSDLQDRRRGDLKSIQPLPHFTERSLMPLRPGRRTYLSSIVKNHSPVHSLPLKTYLCAYHRETEGNYHAKFAEFLMRRTIISLIDTWIRHRESSAAKNRLENYFMLCVARCFFLPFAQSLKNHI